MKSKELYTLRQQLVSNLTRAMGNPARIAMLEFIAEKKTCYFGEIEENIPLAKATISRHLQELRNAGLIDCATEGSHTRFWIHRKNWDFARQVFNQFFAENFDEIKD